MKHVDAVLGCCLHRRRPLAALGASSVPVRARAGHGGLAKRRSRPQIGAEVLEEGGNAVDAAVATAFALAVVHPTAGNIGGGGFMVFRPASGDPIAYDFREMAPAGSSATMFLVDGKYDARRASQQPPVRSASRARSPVCIWRGRSRASCRGGGSSTPAVKLARDGFPLIATASRDRCRAVARQLARSTPASLAQFSKNGAPYEAGETLQQPDLARTLERIADTGAGRILRGRDRGADREGDEGARRAHHPRGSRRTTRPRSGRRSRARIAATRSSSMPPPSSGGSRSSRCSTSSKATTCSRAAASARRRIPPDGRIDAARLRGSRAAISATPTS